MDALGNITDLSLEDPGYTEMVGDPTYTLTFPSIFSAGETPDVELPPGTKYQVEVKATNDVGVDNAFSNDVMPVAGVLQTSVITANTLKPGGWNEVAAPQANNFASISYDGSGRFVAVSSDGIQRSMYSDDGGSSWTIVNMPGENLWSSVAYGNGYFVAVSRNGTPRAAYSSDATSWSGPAGNNTDNIDWHGVAYGAGSFVAVGSNGAMESDDNGASWSQRNYASSGVSGNWKGVVYGTPSTGANAGSGVFVAVSSGSTTMYSLNKGFDWIAGGATTGENFVSVAYNNGIFVAVSENSGSMYSTDGINWTAGTSNADSAWRGITYGAGKFVAVARSGTYRTMHSSDGMSWEYGVAIDSGWDAVVYGGDRYVSVSNDGNTMWSLYGNDSYTELTTVDTTNYNLFSAGDEVVESIGGTPETSAIINVANTPINKTQAYVFTGTPTNLADVLANGTLVTTGNTWNSSQCLVLVNNADSTIPDMTSVFSANGDTSFYLGLGESYGNPTNGGSFKADGTRLGGSGGYNNSEWTLMRYTDIANDENYDSSYRIYDDTEVAYTVIGYYNANSNITFGTIADVGTANRSLLTLTNDTNLANFRVGDVVESQGSSGVTTQVPVNSSGSPIATSEDWAAILGVDPSNTSGPSVMMPDGGGIYASQGRIYFAGMTVGDKITWFGTAINDGPRSCGGNVEETSVPLPGTSLGSFQVTVTAPSGYFKVDWNNSNDKCYGLTPSTNSYTIIVTAINEATPSITTDGGIWSGTDGTASGPNTSYNWSTAGTVTGAGAQYISKAFDGDLNTDWYGPSTYTFPATVVGTKYEIDFNVSLSSSGFFINDTSPSSVGIDTPTGHYLLDITALCPNGLDKITINFVSGVASQYISAIYVDGRLLLDSSDATVTPQTFVTGPTFPAATGTISSIGSREVTAAIQTSTIINVANGTTPTYSSLGVYAGLGNEISPLPNAYDGTYVADGQPAFPSGVTYWGADNGIKEHYGLTIPFSDKVRIYYNTNSTTGASVRINGVTKNLIMMGGSGQNAGVLDWTSAEIDSPFTAIALISANSNVGVYVSAIEIDGVVLIDDGPQSVLTLTDTTDLALFTPGDIVQGNNTPDYSKPTNLENASYGVNVGKGWPEILNQTMGSTWDTNGSQYWCYSSGGSSITFQYTSSNPISLYVTSSGGAGNTITITGDVSETSAVISNNTNSGGICEPTVLTPTKTSGTFTITQGASTYYWFNVGGNLVKVVSTNVSTPSITTSGGDWTGSDGTSSGFVDERQTKVTGPVKTITQSGPYIIFSETTGRWLVTHSDYDTDKKLDTKVKAPLVLDASNSAHVALFNSMNTKFTAFPSARQTFIDALRTKIIGLTLTTPELEVLCGSSKSLIISQPTKQ